MSNLSVIPAEIPFVTPAQAGAQTLFFSSAHRPDWTPAFAGVTTEGRG